MTSGHSEGEGRERKETDLTSSSNLAADFLLLPSPLKSSSIRSNRRKRIWLLSQTQEEEVQVASHRSPHPPSRHHRRRPRRSPWVSSSEQEQQSRRGFVERNLNEYWNRSGFYSYSYRCWISSSFFSSSQRRSRSIRRRDGHVHATRLPYHRESIFLVSPSAPSRS